jgi:hypothetical protein
MSEDLSYLDLIVNISDIADAQRYDADAEGKRGTDQWARRNVEMQDYQRQMYYLNEEYKEMQRQSYLANSNFTKLGNGLQRTSKMMKAVGGAFQEVGGAITQVGAVATAGGALCVM